MTWISIDVDIDDVYNEMSSRDKDRMAEWLDKDGYLADYKLDGQLVVEDNKLSPLEAEFTDKLIKLAPKFHFMSNEDTELIENLYKKYC